MTSTSSSHGVFGETSAVLAVAKSSGFLKQSPQNQTLSIDIMTYL
jgi:hypothetical protein